jgi:hypothetical protein
MTFQTISTFEKPGGQIEAELWATPGWFKFSQCFLYEGNPYIARLDLKSSVDGSYVEYYLDYHDENAYRAWHDEWKHIHDEVRFNCFESLKSRGVQIKLYWPAEELGGRADVQAFDTFVSKITA